ncbi:tetraacyldisaccharide 4'-kinase [Gramella sp. GC03-9]|uniref:Tetraacyldisaccharide 4'-kinase n=1 Tax=Christiangramia oceanisediminis TaxID=2920386 RepID=A0A9X2RAF1_9FLAO|nr:tetraacyldisaccharide 4'-kinase [Gramella oceanisediminis]MCP9201412.1 tetraacyldisaccharide 4'-kinase [Gramella oceanisediminis]
MSKLRKILFPFSGGYHLITGVRNWMYDMGLLKSESYDLPVICVGNLNVGGTGKSPMIEYLIALLQDQCKVAVLSRGYKRKTTGFKLVETGDTVAEVGDEPLQFKTKFPDVLVAVEANRREGISRLQEFEPEVILLDDAFQHRKVRAGFNILLTAYGDLFTGDLLLPAGNLRESASGASRANVMIVTKCPPQLSEEEKSKIILELKPKEDQRVFFSGIEYSEVVHSNFCKISLSEIPEKAILVTGIANPRPLLDYLIAENKVLEHFEFPDHHNFTEKEIRELETAPFILTTEKDYMRLKHSLPGEKLGYLPIRTKFLGSAKAEFDRIIMDYIK